MAKNCKHESEDMFDKIVKQATAELLRDIRSKATCPKRRRKNGVLDCLSEEDLKELEQMLMELVQEDAEEAAAVLGEETEETADDDQDMLQNLNFVQAVESLKNGYDLIRVSDWPVIYFVTEGDAENPLLEMNGPGGVKFTWTPTVESITSNKWQAFKAAPAN